MNAYIDHRLAMDLRMNLKAAGFQKIDGYVIKNVTDIREDDVSKNLLDILEMIDDVSLPTDYFKTHGIFELWSHDTLPSQWIPVSVENVTRAAQDRTNELLYEVMQDARPKRVALVLLTLEALKQANVKSDEHGDVQL